MFWRAPSVLDASMGAGKTVKVAKGGAELIGGLTAYDPKSTKSWTLGTLTEGSLTLIKAGATQGAAVEGTLTAKWSSKGGKK